MLVSSAIVLRSSVHHPTQLNPVDRVVLRVSARLQSSMSGLAHALHRGFSNYVAVVGAARDNQVLRAENARLAAELLAAQSRLGHERELERLIGFSKHVNGQTVAAHVVGADTNAFFRVARLRLDRGEGEVKPGMAVLAPEGVVGRVQRVYGPWCDVLLAVDAKSSIDVRVPRTGSKGLLRGAGARDRYRATLELESPQAAVQVGDLVVASGLGGSFPRDVPIGKIVRIGRHDLGLFQTADVEPVVDFAKLDQVLVLLNAIPPEEEMRAPIAGDKEPRR
jgi:rod shape-determining protein MreC